MVNVLPKKYLEGLIDVVIEESSEKLIAYNGTEIKNVGVVKLLCNVRKKSTILDFFVIEDNHSVPILGLDSCVRMVLIRKLDSITLNNLLDKYKDVFKGIGCFKKNFSIKLKNNIYPVSKLANRVPLTLRS